MTLAESFQLIERNPAPLGTERVNYSGPQDGPYNCGHCEWQTKGNCEHPEVLKDDEVPWNADHTAKSVEPGGCCKYQRKADAAEDIIDLTQVLQEGTSYAPGSRDQPRAGDGRFHPHSPRHMDFQGIPVYVEHPAGTVRRGEGWQTTMQHHYGRIKNCLGLDGDDLDCFIGPNENAADVYIVHTMNPATNTPDEEKCFIGFDRAEDATAAFHANYDDPACFGRIDAMSLDQFKHWIGLLGSSVELDSRQRSVSSPYWHKPVHQHEAHIDFNAFDASNRATEAALAQLLKGPLQDRIIKAVARQAAMWVRSHTPVRQWTWHHDPDINLKIRLAVIKGYAQDFNAMQSETSRQTHSETLADFPRIDDSKPALLADLASQRYWDVYQTAAIRRTLEPSFATEFSAEGEDLFVNALHDVADSNADRIALETSRTILRTARGDALAKLASRPGLVWRRSSVLEPSTCPPCAKLDGTRIAGPTADLAKACDGGERCRCIPYADLTEV